MCKELPYTEVIDRVKAVNKTLLDCGFNYKEIEVFWKDCIKQVRNMHSIKTSKKVTHYCRLNNCGALTDKCAVQCRECEIKKPSEK